MKRQIEKPFSKNFTGDQTDFKNFWLHERLRLEQQIMSIGSKIRFDNVAVRLGITYAMETTLKVEIKAQISFPKCKSEAYTRCHTSKVYNVNYTLWTINGRNGLKIQK